MEGEKEKVEKRKGRKEGRKEKGRKEGTHLCTHTRFHFPLMSLGGRTNTGRHFRHRLQTRRAFSTSLQWCQLFRAKNAITNAVEQPQQLGAAAAPLEPPQLLQNASSSPPALFSVQVEPRTLWSEERGYVVERGSFC
jgi:hypothetical protein